MFKTKLVLLAFCLTAVAGSEVYFKGVNDGIASVDAEAFESYTHFAKQMRHETHRMHAKAHEAQTVWAVLESEPHNKH